MTNLPPGVAVFTSRPRTCTAVRWEATPELSLRVVGASIVEWIEDNGGEATLLHADGASRFDTFAASRSEPAMTRPEPTIAIRTAGSPAVAAFPGCYIRMGRTFVKPAAYSTHHEYQNNGHGQAEHAPYCRCARVELSPAVRLRSFHPHSPEEFERMWVPL